MPAEIILIGGAAIVEHYGFRNMTTDVDAIIEAASVMKEAANKVGDRFNLPTGWLNNDFVRTKSYSDKLIQYSEFHNCFCQVLNVRIITGEYLIAMKLKSFRRYKNDISDIIGILAEHEKRNEAISLTQIENAVINLYGSWSACSKEARDFITGTIYEADYERLFESVRENEKLAKDQLIKFQNDEPGMLKEENVEDILAILRKKKPQ